MDDITLRLPASRLTRIHDAVAQGYNSHSGIIGRKNDTVLHMLAQRLHELGTGRGADDAVPLDVLDLGVGDGALLAQLQCLQHPLRFTGLDISPAMLAAASARLPLRAVLAAAQDAEHHLQARSPVSTCMELASAALIRFSNEVRADASTPPSSVTCETRWKPSSSSLRGWMM
jgi:SAM-dependent methyltransferase